MVKRYLHLISHEGLLCCCNIGNTLAPLDFHPANDEGYTSFAAWLQRAQAGKHTLLADLADEAYQLESIPAVRGADRRALIARRLAQHCFGSPYSTFVSLGREREGRRDERILLTCIPRAALLDPWVSQLSQQEVAMAALYTPALLTPALLQRIHPDAPHGLLVSFSHTGIRQTYFEGKSLRFSRLSPAPEGMFSSWGEACLRETQKTLQYLSAQRWITRSTQLPVWLLLAQEDYAPVLAAVEQAAQLEFRLLNLATLADQCGQSIPPASSDSLPLFMRLALHARNTPQLAPPAARQTHRLHQARLALRAGGLALGVALALGALKVHLDTRELRQQTAQWQQQLRNENQRHQQLLASLPPFPAPLPTLQELETSHASLLEARRLPARALLALSQSLESFPDVQLDTLAWQIAPIQSATPPSLSLELRARLTPGLTPRASLARIREFTTNLGARGTDSSLLEAPFNTASHQTLSKDPGLDSSEAPSFRLRLTLVGGQP